MAAVALLAGAGCKKKEGATGQAAAGGTLKADVGIVKFPADVLAFGGVKSLDEFTAAAAGMVSKFNPQLAAMVGAQIPAMLQGQVLGVKSLQWLDSKKPIRIVVLDYKKYGQPVVVVFPHKGKDAVTAALPDNKAAGAPDNETKFTSPMGQELYLNLLGDNAVFTMDPKAYAGVKAFIEGDFAKYEMAEVLDVQASSVNFQRVAGPEINQLKDDFAKIASSAPGAVPMPGIEKLLQDEIAMFMDLLAQTDTARLALRWDGETVSLKAGLKVVEGKSLAKLVAGTKERKLDLYKTLPAGGWLVAAANLDPSLSESWAKLGMEFWAGLLKLSAEERAKLDELMKQSMEVQTGDTAFWIGRDGEFPMRVLSVGGVKDGEKAKAAAYGLYTMLFSKLGVLVDQYAAPVAKDMPKLDWTSLKAFMDGLKPVLAEVGVTAAFRAETVSGVAVDALELTVDFAKVPGAQDPQFADVAKVVGNKVSAAIGFDKARMYGAFGKDAVADVGTLAKGVAGTGGLLADAIAKHGADTQPAMAIWVSFTDVMKVLAIFDPDVNANMPGLATAQGDIGFAFVMGGHGDRVLDAVLTVPVTKIAGLLPKGPAAAPIAPAPAPQP
jgi:hypothetical protein